MVDNLKPEDRLKTMRAVKSKGTKLEIRLFAMLAGLRLKGWRRNADDIVGKPDAVFDRERVAIFVDGCFWHGCPHCKRKLPDTNREYWERKINRNIERAERYNQELTNAQWGVVRIWEHEMRGAASRKLVGERLRQIIEGRTSLDEHRAN